MRLFNRPFPLKPGIFLAVFNAEKQEPWYQKVVCNFELLQKSRQTVHH